MTFDLENIFNERNDRINRELFYKGYAKIGKLDSEILSELKAKSHELIQRTKSRYPGGQLYNLINADSDTKTASNQMIAKYLIPFLKEKFNGEIVDIYPVSHLIKPFGLKSGIWHQDSSIVDERTDFSLNAWTSLVDSHRLNGCIWIFPGSHINDNHFRQFGYNPIEKDLLKALEKKLVPVHTEAGEVLVFHRNLIHGSSRNWLPKARIAIEGVVVPKGVQFYNFHREESISKNKILGFQVDMKHFMGPAPKEDFYNGRYRYTEFDDPGFEGMTRQILDNMDRFERHAKLYEE